MPKKVRSEIFHAAASMSEHFKKHLNVVWTYPRARKEALLAAMPAVVQAITERDEWSAREQAVKSLGGDTNEALQAVEVLKYIGKKWHPLRDLPSVAIQDFLDLDLVPKEPKQKSEARWFLLEFFNFLQEDSVRRTDVTFARSLLPSLVGVSAVVDHRAVIESEFDWRNDDPDKYRSVANRTVPVIILRITRDEGDPIVLQCSSDEVEMLLRQLQAVLKDVAASSRLLRS